MMTAQAEWEHCPGGLESSDEDSASGLEDEKESASGQEVAVETAPGQNDEEETASGRVVEKEDGKEIDKGKGKAKKKKDNEEDEAKVHPGLQQLQEGGKEAERKIAEILEEAGYGRGAVDEHGEQHVNVTPELLQVVFPTTVRFL
jgi:hypothetical protein